VLAVVGSIVVQDEMTGRYYRCCVYEGAAKFWPLRLRPQDSAVVRSPGLAQFQFESARGKFAATFSQLAGLYRAF
jgi:hypothetical protein